MTDEQQTQDQTTNDMAEAAEMMAEAMQAATRSLGELGSVSTIAAWASHYAAEMYRVQMNILSNELDLIKQVAIRQWKTLSADMKANMDEDWTDEQMAFVSVLKTSADIRGKAAERSMRFATEVTEQILSHFGGMGVASESRSIAYSAMANISMVAEMRAYMGECSCSKDEDEKEEPFDCECSRCRQERVDSTTPG